jgi:hypothetical protein
MKKIIVAAAIVAGTCGLCVPSVSAADTNHGVVKINNEVAPDKAPSTHPKVGCTFAVDFYNYPKGDYKATVAFELQSPTATKDHTLKVSGGDLHPTIGADAAGGDKDLDGSQKYTLAFTGKAQDKQGYHVKLTINAPGSKGNSKKEKIFWVEACAPKVQGAQTNDLPHTGADLSAIVGWSGLIAVAGYAASYLHFRQKRATKQI